MRERDIERYLVNGIKALGGEVRKVRWIGRRGAPDRVVMLPTPCSQVEAVLPSPPIWVELKAPGGVPEPHQTREHRRMRRMGQRVEVLATLEAVDKFLGELK